MKYLILLLSLTACQGSPGRPGIDGHNGQSIVGPKGDPGDSITGPAGPDGADGTIITIVQFCVGLASTYPSTFPEVGLCINGNIYAVYSANDGFLALITPGVYNSNAVGSACTFSVSENCVVTN